MDNAEARYDQLIDDAAALYEQGQSESALQLMDAVEAELGAGLEPWSAELAHLRACLLGTLDRADDALQVLVTACAAGAWWHEQILTEDDDLAALQDLPAFQEIVQTSRVRHTSDPVPPLIELPAPGRPVVRVVVALHGAGLRAGHAAREWAEVLEDGAALVCVESSQLMSPMYRTWPDRAKAVEDIAAALEHLPAELRGLPMIAAGFSAGGRAALDWALTGQPVPVAGVVVLGPALRELPETAHSALSPAVVLIGTDDELVEVVDEAAGQLTAFGLTIVKLPGLGHEFPADFGPLRDAISGASTSKGA